MTLRLDTSSPMIAPISVTIAMAEDAPASPAFQALRKFGSAAFAVATTARLR